MWKLTIRKRAPSVTAFILTSRSRGTTKKNILHLWYSYYWNDTRASTCFIFSYSVHCEMRSLVERQRFSSGTVWHYKCTHHEVYMHRRLSLLRPNNRDTSSELLRSRLLRRYQVTIERLKKKISDRFLFSLRFFSIESNFQINFRTRNGETKTSPKVWKFKWNRACFLRTV